MSGFFFQGKLSRPLLMAMYMNDIYASIFRRKIEAAETNKHIEQAYEGEFTESMRRYHEVGLDHYEKLSQMLLQDVDLEGRRVLEVGCGTGILSRNILDRGAATITCADVSDLMLEACRSNSRNWGFPEEMIEFRKCGAQELPFEGGSFDSVACGMVLGMVPDKAKAMNEMARVLRPGGTLAMSVHGPAHYREFSEVMFRMLILRYPLQMTGYKPEYFPLDEKSGRKLFNEAGLSGVNMKRESWTDKFESPDQAFDFYSGTTGFWWLCALPLEKRDQAIQHAHKAFQRKGTTDVTMDVVFARGTKP